MLITEREAEEICIALMKLKTPDGKYSLRGGELSAHIFAQIVETRRIVLEVEKREK